MRLEVVVGADGAVQSMRIVEGAPPFSTAAMAAVATSTFEPAQKGGRAITARFLLDVRVAPPPAAPPAATPAPEPEAAEPEAPSSPPAAPAATSTSAAVASGTSAAPSPPALAMAASPLPASVRLPPPPIDVHVEGARPRARVTPDAGGVHLSPAAVARVPGAFGDPFRAIEILPGVVPYVSGLPYFFVRGATPTTTGYFIDGIPVPLLFHVGGGPAVIAPSMIGGVDFFPGGYPVAFGRQTGGILAAQSATPPPRVSAEATLRVVDASARVSAPLPDERGVAFAAGRVSFTQGVVPLLTPDLSLGYWDYQAGASYQIARSERLRLLAFGADDFLSQRSYGEMRPIYKAQFHRVDLAYEREASGALLSPRVRVAGTFGFDRSHLVGQGDIEATMGQVRALAEVPLHRTVRVRAGADLLAEARSLDRAPLRDRPITDDGSFAKTFADRTVGTFGAFADVALSPLPFLDFVAGGRADFFGDPSGGAVGLDPRASARIGLLPWLTAVTTFGLAHQRPSFVLPMPGVVPASTRLVLQESMQMSQGIEARLPFRILAQATAYLNEQRDMTDYLATCWRRAAACRFFTRASGRSYGMELLLQRSLTEQLGGQVAYTLSRTERTSGGETFAADSDRTHVVHVVLGYELLPGLHASARLTAYSGRPFTLSAGKRNVARGPGFYRLDLRVSKTWRLGRTAYVSAVLEGLNVTLSKEWVDLDCRLPIDLGGRCGPQEIGPLTLPSLGVSGGF